MVVAGNTTMLHLLYGVDPTSLGIAPFTPTFLKHRITEFARSESGGEDAEVGAAGRR